MQALIACLFGPRRNEEDAIIIKPSPELDLQSDLNEFRQLVQATGRSSDASTMTNESRDYLVVSFPAKLQEPSKGRGLNDDKLL